MAKAKLSKNNNKKKKNLYPGKKIKSLKADQKRKPVPVDKSVNSLKKIQKQLDDLVKQRSKEKKQINALKETTKSLAQQLEDSESRFPKLALNKDLKKLKSKLRVKNTQFLTITDKLSREISLFKDLTERVTGKILTLEKASEPSKQQLHDLTQDHERLFNKISHFEAELAQFNIQFVQPEQAIAEFSQQLEQLHQFVSQVKRTSQEQDSLIKLLQTDTSNIRKSLQQILGIDNKMAGLMPKLASVEKQNQQLTSQTDQLGQKFSVFEAGQQQLLKPLEAHFKELELNLQTLQDDHKEQQQTLIDDKKTLSQFISQVNQFDEQLKQSQDVLKRHMQQLLDSARESDSVQFEQLVSQVNHNYREQDTQIKLLQTDTNNIRISLQRIQNIDDKIVNLIPKLDSLDKQNQHLTTQMDRHDRKLTALEEAQQQLTRPLEDHLNELEQNLQSLHKDYTEQQNTLIGDTEKLTQLTHRVSQFDELLHQSHDELKQHIQLLHESENNKNSQLFNQFSNKLAHLAQQLSEVAEQSADLKTRFSGLQKHQDIALEQLTSGQQQLTEVDKTRQDNITTLARKLAQGQVHYQENISKLEIQQDKQKNVQQEQIDNLNRLGEQIKTRSHFFGIGLVAVLAIATLLLFNQEIVQDDSEKQTLISAIKSDINNETYRKINALTKQNSTILQGQLSEIRNSIEQVKQDKGQSQQAEVQKLQNGWQEQYQLLQEDISKAQTNHQALQQSVSELSKTISSIRDEFQHSQDTSNYNAVLTNNRQGILVAEVTNIKTITTPFYAIQLIGALQKESIHHFLVTNNLFKTTTVYQTELRGQPWYILIHGHYTSYSQAREQIKQLPEKLIKQSPWVRKLP